MSAVFNLFMYSVPFRMAILFVFGACIGSFVNVVIFRLPIMLSRKYVIAAAEVIDIDYIKPDSYPDRFNLLTPQSRCFKCNTNIGWLNIPILGYIFTRGKCIECKHKYSIQYLVVELTTALLFALVGYMNSNLFIILAQMIFISIVICAIVIDYNTLLLPDELTLPLLWIGLLVNLHGLISGGLARAVLGAAIGYLLLWSIYWIFKLITKREGMGYGDFKFLAAILAWLGLNAIIPVLIIAPLLGIGYFIAVYIARKISISSIIPFGPFLGISAIVTLLFSNRLIQFVYL